MRVMVDIEAVGPDGAIVSIGACTFGTQGASGEEFYVAVQTNTLWDNGFVADPKTLSWWCRQDPGAREVLNDPDAVHIRHALKKFRRWLKEVGATEIWSHDYDRRMLRDAYGKIGEACPWTYPKERDYRTLCELAGIGRIEGDKPHHALLDAMMQARHAEKALEVLGNGRQERGVAL